MPDDRAAAYDLAATHSATVSHQSKDTPYLAAADFVRIGEPGADGKTDLYLAKRDLRIRLHQRQLALLQLYDGFRSTDAVRSAYMAQTGKAMRADVLHTFESKMRGLGFLEQVGQTTGQSVDPFAGIEYGLSRRRPPKVIFTLSDPNRSLDPVLQSLFRPVGLAVTTCLALIVVYGWVVSFQQAGAVWGQLPRLLNTLWWVIVFYPVWFVVMTVHEFGHALACMAKNVPMREVGIGRRGMLFVGWAKPDQAIWSALSYRDKVFTVVAGPLVNIAFFGIGVVIWSLIGNQTISDIVLTAALLPLFTMIPTLIPTNKGDAYLLMSEAMGAPGYYTKATRHIWSTGQRLREGRPADLLTPLGVFGLLVMLTRVAMLSVIALGIVQAARLLWQAMTGIA